MSSVFVNEDNAIMCRAKNRLHITVKTSPLFTEKPERLIKPIPIIAIIAQIKSNRSGFLRKISAPRSGTNTTYKAVKNALLPAVVYFAPIV